jgi:orotidine-5'-phosphate decarboxylase
MSPIIVALDYANTQDALDMASQLDPKKCRVKVGKELFTAVGPEVIKGLHKLGFEIFLDLKFHDIPNTVAGAVSVAADLGIWMVNVHASGGQRMMEAAVESVANKSNKPHLIAVTVLTSMTPEDLQGVGFNNSPLEQVLHLARLSKQSGMDGVVCSAMEVTSIRNELASPFMLVTPGIRPANAEQGDQRRIMTPEQALAAGSDYLVIGRPITRAANPLASLNAIYEEVKA